MDKPQTESNAGCCLLVVLAAIAIWSSVVLSKVSDVQNGVREIKAALEHISERLEEKR